eukprot:GEMP01033648.1.p1 GENE.GEMP01033648.1~~GEMP01033648.1.p1  ORF type:complete len:430 (+),score=100.78 GEMP01033648.1:131-1420(+)
MRARDDQMLPASPLHYIPTPRPPPMSASWAVHLNGHHASSSSSAAASVSTWGATSRVPSAEPPVSTFRPPPPTSGAPLNSFPPHARTSSNFGRDKFVAAPPPCFLDSRTYSVPATSETNHAFSPMYDARADVPAAAAPSYRSLQRDVGRSRAGENCTRGRGVVYSTSSALPDEMPLDKIPKLVANVHDKLAPEFLRDLRPEDLHFRSFREGDLAELKMLHQEWFPLTYDDTFYGNAVNGNGKLLTCAAVLPGDDACILGLTTLSTHCHHHHADISRILNGHCDTACQSGSRIAYILTLGVIDEFRRRGLAKQLILEAIKVLEATNPQVQALTLHVVTYNKAAIALYHALGFVEIGQFHDYYDLNGTHFGSYLLAKYLQDIRPPLTVRLRQASAHIVGWGQSRLSAFYSWFRAKIRFEETNNDDEVYAMI